MFVAFDPWGNGTINGTGVATGSASWEVSKMASWIAVGDVLQNGSQLQHGQWGGARAVGRRGVFVVQSPDAGVVAPQITAGPAQLGQATPFPASAELGMAPLKQDQVTGMAFLLHSNGYNTNYPLWYPFTGHGAPAAADATLRFRFNALFSR